MKFRSLLQFLALIAISFSLSGFQCGKDRYESYSYALRATVIGKESCKNDTTKDYWLVDLSHTFDTTRSGDTLEINDSTYYRVYKTLQLDSALKKPGLEVVLYVGAASDNKIASTGCTVQNPVTYALRECYITDQRLAE